MDTTVDTRQGFPGAAASGRKVTEQERVYLQLRDDLLAGAISPLVRITEMRVAERYSVSRTPARDALARLRADRLLAFRDGALYRYMPTRKELSDLYELRVTLERQGIVRCTGGADTVHDTALIEDELALWHERKSQGVTPDAGFVTADEQFHLTLLLASGNTEMVEILKGVNQRIRSVRMHDYLTQDRINSTIDEHLEIGELVLTGRLLEALEALESHIGESQTVSLARATDSFSL
ncbi:GntR family transcriptional regulator [Citricoccus muralis]|uniref:GntR family transcriptional regulator n=1 Tax=Citricoccus muralis TaxID=169134 RepID=UPI000E24076D|nr:GntR family transcriptional regulator [Citricoccus muralis]